MENLLTIENLSKDNPNEFEPTDSEGYYRRKDGPLNVWTTLEPPNLDVIKVLVKANQVIDPLSWLIKFENIVHVNYDKYLELMECKAINNNNQKMLKTVQEYKTTISKIGGE